MKFKYKYISVLASLMACTFIGCNDDFLDKHPETSLTEETFFKNVKDLETYTYSLYDMIPFSYDDNNSDNILYHTDGTSLESMIRGEVDPDRTSKWNWESLRSVNFLLAHISDAEGDESEIKHYEALGRFFRALFYWNQVKTFGDVPWYDKVLNTNDVEDLYKPRDSREMVMDKVLEDLIYAVENTKIVDDRTYLSKYPVAALAARIALYEGTFRKYQTDLNLSGGEKYLEKAVEWSKLIMDDSRFELTQMDQWVSMFNDNVLDGNKEMIMFKKHSKELGVGNNTHTVCDTYWALSGSLVNSFLNEDGSRFTDLPDYKKKTYVETFKNRDPRLSATVLYPGCIRWDDKNPTLVRPEFGGFPQLKFYPARRDLALGWIANYTDLPIVRLAEMYVTYAEAKAELGTLTQNDLDISVNKLRSRASLPAINLSVANSDIDPVLAEQYNTISGTNKGVLLEIMRERRVELACEGLRKDDLYRHKLGTNMVRFVGEGMYVPQLGPLDVTGDNEPDIVILEQASDGDVDKYGEMPVYYLKDKDGKETTWYLENGANGHIRITSFRDTKREFKEPQYYFYPIPTTEMVLNDNLKQLYGW